MLLNTTSFGSSCRHIVLIVLAFTFVLSGPVSSQFLRDPQLFLQDRRILIGTDVRAIGMGSARTAGPTGAVIAAGLGPGSSQPLDTSSHSQIGETTGTDGADCAAAAPSAAFCGPVGPTHLGFHDVLQPRCRPAHL